MVIQSWPLLLTAQLQIQPVCTAMVPTLAWALCVRFEGVICGQAGQTMVAFGSPDSCFTMNVWPAMVIVPVRGANVGFWAT